MRRIEEAREPWEFDGLRWVATHVLAGGYGAAALDAIDARQREIAGEPAPAPEPDLLPEDPCVEPLRLARAHLASAASALCDAADAVAEEDPTESQRLRRIVEVSRLLEARCVDLRREGEE